MSSWLKHKHHSRVNKRKEGVRMSGDKNRHDYDDIIKLPRHDIVEIDIEEPLVRSCGDED